MAGRDGWPAGRIDLGVETVERISVEPAHRVALEPGRLRHDARRLTLVPGEVVGEKCERLQRRRALPALLPRSPGGADDGRGVETAGEQRAHRPVGAQPRRDRLAKDRADALDILGVRDRKSTRLNSSHSQISYAVFCLKKK